MLYDASRGVRAGSMGGIANEIGLTHVEGALRDVGRQVANMSHTVGGEAGGPISDGVQRFADEIAAWMGLPLPPSAKTPALPPGRAMARV